MTYKARVHILMAWAFMLLCLASAAGRRHHRPVFAPHVDPFEGWDGEWHGSCTEFISQPSEAPGYVCSKDPLAYPHHLKLGKKGGQWSGDGWWDKTMTWDQKGHQYGIFNGSVNNFKVELLWTDSIGKCVRVSAAKAGVYFDLRCNTKQLYKDTAFVLDARWYLNPVKTKSGLYKLAACPTKNQYATMECNTPKNYYGSRCMLYKRGVPSVY